MPRRFWIVALSLWPGLPQIWSGQEILGLFLAAGFAACLNLAIVSNTIWTEAFPPGAGSMFATLAVACWIGGIAYTSWWVWRCHPERFRAQIDRLYREANEAYLQGRWNEARRRFEAILAMDDTDADVLMQLGTLYVRTEQHGLARRAFRQCLELEGGQKWRWEIAQAMGRIGPA